MASKEQPIISVDFSDGHEVFQTYYQRDFTENQRRAILHICANAGKDPEPPNAQWGADAAQDVNEIAAGRHARDRAAMETVDGFARKSPVSAEETLGKVAADRYVRERDAGAGTFQGTDEQLRRSNAVEKARLTGYTGDMCTSCGSTQMRRNGACLLCESCHQTTGCS